jgi:hypothetical protein
MNHHAKNEEIIANILSYIQAPKHPSGGTNVPIYTELVIPAMEHPDQW